MDTLDWLNLKPHLSDVETWSKLWAVHDEPFARIRCRICDSHQRLEEAHKAFSHHPLCKLRGSQSRYPWRDILWIMEHVQHPG